MKPIISVEGLGKKYVIRHEGQTHYKSLREEIFQLPKKLFRRQDNKEEFWAIKDVSFDIMPGDRVGIIGRNGAGKSTLLKLLSRITEPTTGRMTLRGRVASLLEVGTGFHPELSGRENIFLNGAVLGMSRAEVRNKFDEIVDFAGVEKFLDTPVKRYSSGMYVRLAFAVAAHLEPEILIVDEVLAVGDAEFQKKCLGKMEDVSNAGRTVLFVSHNMAAMQHLCRRGILLHAGQILNDASASDAIQSYILYQNKTVDISVDGVINLDNAREYEYKSSIFKTMQLLDMMNKSARHFEMGRSFKVLINLEGSENYPDCDYCVAIRDMNDQWMTSFATWMFPVAKKASPKKIYLHIPKIQLSPGKYKIYLSATLHTAGIYIDRIENAAIFEVTESDVFGSGRSYSSDCGIFFTDAHFSVEE